MATIGEDQNMCLFDTNENKLLQVKYLGNTPTAIRFSPDGSLLVIGFMNGDVILFDYKIDKNTYGRMGEKFELPPLTMAASLKDTDTRTPVLNIEFSPKADFLAVSYDNGRSNSSKEYDGENKEKEGSFIRIYYNKAGATNRSKNAGELQKKSYSRKLDIRCPSTVAFLLFIHFLFFYFFICLLFNYLFFYLLIPSFIYLFFYILVHLFLIY